MISWEWSLGILFFAPFAAYCMALFFERKQAAKGQVFFLLLSGIAALIACGNGVMSDSPFSLETSIFFDLVVVWDKFSALLFLPIACVMIAVGTEQMQAVRTGNDDATLSPLQTCGIAGLILSISATFMVTNIVGLAAALLILLLSSLLLAAGDRIPDRSVVQWCFVRALGIVCVIAGWFVLSSGALFNDFATVSYIASELEIVRIIFSFALVAIGSFLMISGEVFNKSIRRFFDEIKLPGARALLRAGWFVVPAYILLRMLLFIFPPLSMWFAIPFALLSVFSFFCWAQQRNLNSGVFFLAVSLAVFAQATGMIEAMNVAVFSAILIVFGGVIGDAAGEWPVKHARFGVWSAVAQHICRIGLPPTILFSAQWMLFSTLVTIAISSGADAARAMIFLIAVWVSAVWQQGKRAIAIFRTEADEQTNIVVWPPILLMGMSMISAFAAPWALETIGAGPLTLAGGAWNAALISGQGALRITVLSLTFILCIALLWVLRDRSVVDGVALDQLHDVPVRESRWWTLRREILRQWRQGIVIPLSISYERGSAWYHKCGIQRFAPDLVCAVMILFLFLFFFL